MSARPDEFLDNWSIQVRKGVIELCILNALRDDERYGYELVKSLVMVPGLDVAEGTIYPLLSRLRQQGLVTARLEESPSGPARRFYALTDGGRVRLEAMNRYFFALSAAVGAVAHSGAGKPIDLN
jgi:PadR family transcriptional regulator PadR